MVLAVPGVRASSGPSIGPLVATDGRVPQAPWKLATLPQQTLPITRFKGIPLAAGLAPPGLWGDPGKPEWALQIEAEASYGNLLQTFDDALERQQVAGLTLAWSWKVERSNPAIDLASRSGDDTDAKVCVLFDLPLDRVPLGERLLLQLARSKTGEALPAATICYTNDVRQATGTRLDNAYSRRVRYLVLRGAGDDLTQWKSESRRLADDFRQLFGDESTQVPAVRGIAVGADADNTKGTSRALLARLRLEPPSTLQRP